MLIRLRALPMPCVARAALVAAALILSAGPIAWLIETWRDPAYDSHGLLVFAICAALFAWSAGSARPDRHNPRRGFAIALLACSAVSRLLGQVLAVNTVGAVTLILDVFALGLLFGLNARARALSPGWLAISFAFALPLERIVQRCIGFGLQQVSADGACGLLKSIYQNVACEGIRIIVDGRDVLVDIPCSGARTAVLALLALALAATLTRPKVGQALVGLMLTLGASLAANIARITALAAGMAHPERLGGIDVMAAPWHDAIGLAALALATLPILLWARTIKRQRSDECHSNAPAPRVRPVAANTRWPPAFSLAALSVAVIIVNLPRKPADVANRDIAIELPLWLAGHPAEPVALTSRERAYFTQFGGSAAKARYGDHNLLVVRTSSPLRHLHGPDECLRGLGFDVAYLGAEFTPVPTAVYRATAPDGERYRIDVTFVSERGDVATSVAAAVWHWLRGEGAVWTAIQRISNDRVPPAQHREWATAAVQALDLPTSLQPHGVHR